MYYKKEKRPLTKEQEEYLEKLSQFRKQGVKITIDKQELPEDKWDIIFRVSESKGGSVFYLADCIADPEGKLMEIRLDKIRVHNLDDTL